MAMAIATASMNATVAFLTQLLQFIEKNIKKLHLNSNYLPSKRGLWPSRSLIELAKACELQKKAWLLPLLFVCSIPFAPIPYGPVFQSQLHGNVRELNLRESPGKYSGIECCRPQNLDL